MQKITQKKHNTNNNQQHNSAFETRNEEALKRLGPPGGVTRIADASTCLINNI